MIGAIRYRTLPIPSTPHRGKIRGHLANDLPVAARRLRSPQVAGYLSTQALGSLTTLWRFAHDAVAGVGKMGGMAAVGKLVPAPTRCPRGHALRPDRTLLRAVSCSCGRHTTWRCLCGEVIYRPVLSEHCRLLNGRASTRRGQ